MINHNLTSMTFSFFFVSVFLLGAPLLTFFGGIVIDIMQNKTDVIEELNLNCAGVDFKRN